MIEVAGTGEEGRPVEVGAQRPLPQRLPVLPLRETEHVSRPREFLSTLNSF